MKKQVIEYIKSLGATAVYSGNHKTIFINDEKEIGIEEMVIKHFGYNLPFRISSYNL